MPYKFGDITKKAIGAVGGVFGDLGRSVKDMTAQQLAEVVGLTVEKVLEERELKVNVQAEFVKKEE